jgi:hypothetical protein
MPLLDRFVIGIDENQKADLLGMDIPPMFLHLLRIVFADPLFSRTSPGWADVEA